VEILKSILEWIFFSLLTLSIFLSHTACNKGRAKAEPLPGKTSPRQSYAVPGTRPIPYIIGKTYKFLFTTDKGKAGEGIFRIEKTGGTGLRIYSSVDADDVDSRIHTSGEGTLVLDEKFNPVSYDRSVTLKYKDNPKQNGTETVKAVFSNGAVKLDITGPGKNQKETIQKNLINGSFVFDNNYLGQMAYICAQTTLKSGRTEHLNVFSVALRQMIEITMTPKIKVALNFNGQKVIAYEVDMKADGATFGRYYITPDGQLLKAEEMGGFMIIELENPEM